MRLLQSEQLDLGMWRYIRKALLMLLGGFICLALWIFFLNEAIMGHHQNSNSSKLVSLCVMLTFIAVMLLGLMRLAKAAEFAVRGLFKRRQK
jgi:hypothetical protein